MTTTGTNKPSAAVDTSNVIPFPGARAAHKQPEKTESQTFSLPLRKALCRIKDIVLRFAHRPNRAGAQRKRGSSSASAAHHPQHHYAPVLDHRGRAIRERMSA
jgi:hypothetical protein